ncbi:hypothetical protein AB7M29_003820 [Pseudomonas sp. F-14 TE3623]|jgi:hypothetical protein|uniref:Valyl-tRNA synthetase n=3 Tax=Pseudomonas TaxID=286 RepID=A0A0L1MKC4_PSESX|nr:MULTISPECIES: hypothetical protein [Pseudomonas]KNH28932.1 Valyl-tRNA synthetase [Pseudomonas syringae]MBV4463617.1 hypothetical protein [Pseudomonas farris]RON25311.1 hypothetical protein BK663_20345 [Pseudomonas lini]
MRTLVWMAATFVLVTLSLEAQAKDLSKNSRFVCSWGSDIAAGAQASKLSGLTLYGARRKLQARKFPRPWMRMTAMGITEQTYNSPSRLKPSDIKQTYYEQCIKHELAQR